MKKVFFLSTLILSVVLVQAQNYKDIKMKVTLNQFKAAKDDLDKAWNEKFASKAEAHILKTAIYAGLAADETIRKTAEGQQLAIDADAAFRKYKEMEPSLVLVDDPIYQNGPINLYSGFYASGYDDYQAKKWESSFTKFVKAVEMSDFLISKKLLAATVDTNVLILAGITAENSDHKDAAAKYYGRLADNKVTGDGFESVYRFLVSYYFAKKDLASFEKYKAIGLEVYPKSEYFTYDKIDFAVGLETNFDLKVKAVEEILATDPNNFKANQILGEIIYDTLNPREEGAPPHSNAEELEKKMTAAFAKAAAAEPKNELPLIYSGDHYINKGVAINKDRETHAAEMKTRTKPGTMASKEDVAKRDLLDKKYGDALEGARDPYEKAAALFGVKPKSDDKNQALRDKTQYKKVVSYLADIYAFKKAQAKAPADKAKFAAEEKKWNDLWESIK